MKPKQNTPVIAYFSMEIALDPNIPTYSGGLGMLAGDTLRSVADLAVPLVAVSLVYRRGYFRQHLDGSGQQTEQPQPWDPNHTLEAVDERATIEIEGRQVAVRAWKYTVIGVTGATVAVYLLDTDLPEKRSSGPRANEFPVRRRLALSAVSGSSSGARGLQILQQMAITYSATT